MLSSLGFYDTCILIFQLFLNLTKQNWSAELRISTRALCYREISTSIDFKAYLNVVHIPK